MHEEILDAVVGGYESETFLRVEPFHSARRSLTLGHGLSSTRRFLKNLEVSSSRSYSFLSFRFSKPYVELECGL